jgi:membrane protease YdiL (CAAX protease family)
MQLNDGVGTAARIALAPSTNPEESAIRSRENRIAGLSILLALAIAPFLLGSTMRATGVTTQYSAAVEQYRYISALLSELTSLALLWYVLRQNGQTLGGIGLRFQIGDLGHGLLLIIGSSFAFQFTRSVVVRVYERVADHPPAPPVSALAGLQFSFVLLAFALLNPFFEELIVRAFLISETAALTGSTVLAVAISVILQTAYHLYQGIPNALGLGSLFLIFSLNYVRTQRAFPIIIAHLWSEAVFVHTLPHHS